MESTESNLGRDMPPRGREAKKLAKQQNNQNRKKNLEPVKAPTSAKALARQQADDHFLNQTVQWSVRAVDNSFDKLGCRWDLTPTEFFELLQFLEDLSQKTWQEVLNETDRSGRPKHHSQDVTSLDKDAQTRLRKIGQADEEKIFRFRIKGKLRLWGFRTGPVFRILWYDPEHKVYPVAKKNT